MLQAFNPHRLGGTPQQVRVGFDDIRNLLVGATKGANDFASGLNAIGQDVRSDKIVKEIASGNLDNLNSNELQKKLLELKDGSINKDTQTLIDTLIGNKVGQEQASALASAQTGLEQLKQKGALDKQALTNLGNIDVANLDNKSRLILEKLKGSNTIANTKVQGGIDSLLQSMASANKMKEISAAGQNSLALEKEKSKLKAQQDKDSLKFTDPEKWITKEFKGGIENLTDPVGQTTEFYARSNEGFFDTNFEEMPELDKRILTDVTTKVLSSKKGIMSGKFGAEAVKNQIDSELKNTKTSEAPFGLKLDYEFIPSNLLPFGKSPSVPRIVPRTKNDK